MKEIKVECSNCHGEGYADGDSGYSCSVCDGTGWEYEYVVHNEKQRGELI